MSRGRSRGVSRVGGELLDAAWGVAHAGGCRDDGARRRCARQQEASTCVEDARVGSEGGGEPRRVLDAATACWTLRQGLERARGAFTPAPRAGVATMRFGGRAVRPPYVPSATLLRSGGPRAGRLRVARRGRKRGMRGRGVVSVLGGVSTPWPCAGRRGPHEVSAPGYREAWAADGSRMPLADASGGHRWGVLLGSSSREYAWGGRLGRTSGRYA